MANTETGVDDFGGFLLSPIGGAVLGWLYWLVVPKYDVTIGETTIASCARVLGNTYCGWQNMSAVGGLIGFLLAVAIHLVRA